MRAQLSYWLYNIRTGFWFLPAVISALAVVLAPIVLAIDRSLPNDWAPAIDWLFQANPDGSRLFLSTIAGSMMTVTSLVFSLTLLTLTMASSQFGPRLITSFTRDRLNQVVLGTFLATFIYALLVLGAIRGGEDGGFVPQLSIAISLLLAIASFGLLIMFIHHVSTSIQADAVIAAVAADLKSSIDAVFEEIEESGSKDEPTRECPEDPAEAEDGRGLVWNKEGYIQTIDYESVVELAAEYDVALRLFARAGHFVVSGERMAAVAPGDRVDEHFERRLRNASVVGRKRTMTQDVEFALASLVELALRALSPGINDPHTAIVCIDRIGAALVHATKRGIPDSVLADAEGVGRVLVMPVHYAGLLDTAFNEIRQTASGNVAILIRLLDALTRIAKFTRDDSQHRAVRRHAGMIDRCYQAGINEPNDRDDIAEKLERLNAELESH